jgi:Ca2+-binding RTX toxin-like protein
MGDSRTPGLARRPRAASAAMTRTVARWATGIVLVLCLLGVIAAPAHAGAIIYLNGTLVFTNQFDSDPNRSVDVIITESGGRLVIFSAGDVLAFSPGAPCEDVRLYDTVSCDLSAITSFAATLGAGDDRVMVESAAPALLCGAAGDDTLSGGSGEDIVGGADGDDRLSGGAGKDILRADRIHNAAEATCTETPGSPPGANTLDGGADVDLLVGDDGADTLKGGAGDDYEFGRSGDDELDGGDGDDALIGLDGTDRLDGGAGFDVLSGGAGPDNMAGGGGGDHLGIPMLLTVDKGGPLESSLELGDDRIQGGAGDDTLFGGPGDRTLNYNLDTPQRAGGRAEPNGADALSGGDGTDHVSYVNREISVAATLNGRPDDGAPGEGDDIAGDVEGVTGGTADDVIEGGPANDVLDGGPGSDRLRGLDGGDVLEGGPADGGADGLSGGSGPDALSGGPGTDNLDGDDGDDGLRGGGGTDRLDGGAGADALQGEDDEDDLDGGPGPDVLDGGPGPDRVDYADAERAVTVSLDGVRNDGARGEDWVREIENVRGGTRADSLLGDAGVNVIEGGPGHDLIDAAEGADNVSAGPGRDAVLARDEVRDAIACGTGKDVAVADELDVVGGGGESCERTDRGGGARRGEALLRPTCRLEVRLPGAARRLLLSQTLSVPRGTSVNVARCAATLSTGRRAPRVRAAGGTFLLRRAGTRRRALVLALGGPSFSTCRGAPASRRVRTLGIRGRGRVRLAGRYADTSADGASWNVEDRCGSTVTRVRRGRVRVTDRGRRRAVVVRAPRTHVSRPPRGGL